jgi:hypothetical protein
MSQNIDITKSIIDADELEVDLHDIKRDHLCFHTFHNGSFCDEVAMAGQRYCRWHSTAADRLARRVKASKRRTKEAIRDLLIPMIEDVYSHQIAVQEVMDAIIDGRLVDNRAAHLLYALQLAQNNIRKTMYFSHDKYTSASLENTLKEQLIEKLAAKYRHADTEKRTAKKKPPQSEPAPSAVEKEAPTAS